jgi:hypothetical protein
MKDTLVGDAQVALPCFRNRHPLVRVSIEPRKVRARNVDGDPVPSLENITSGDEVDLDPVNGIRFQALRALRPISVT